MVPLSPERKYDPLRMKMMNRAVVSARACAALKASATVPLSGTIKEGLLGSSLSCSVSTPPSSVKSDKRMLRMNIIDNQCVSMICLVIRILSILSLLDTMMCAKL